MSGSEPRIPAFAQRVQSSFDRQQVMKLLGAKLARLALDECDIELPFKAELTQQHGYFHGGIIGTIADSAGGYSDFTLIPEDSSVLTVEYKTNLRAPGQWRTAYRARTCAEIRPHAGGIASRCCSGKRAGARRFALRCWKP